MNKNRPFGNLYWLVTPQLNKEISLLESNDLKKKLQTWCRTNYQGFRDQRNTDDLYIQLRYDTLTDDDKISVIILILILVIHLKFFTFLLKF